MALTMTIRHPKLGDARALIDPVSLPEFAAVGWVEAEDEATEVPPLPAAPVSDDAPAPSRPKK